MKYVKTIFENENIQGLVANNEEIIDLATESLLQYNLELELAIYENLENYVVEGDIAATYENIRNAVVNENINFINEVSLVLGCDASIEDKVGYLQEMKITNKQRAKILGAGSRVKAAMSDMTRRMARSEAANAATRTVSHKAKKIVSDTAKKVADSASKVSSKAADTANAGFDRLGFMGSKGPMQPEVIRALGKKRAAYIAGVLAAAGAAGGAAGGAAKNAQDENDFKKKVAIGAGGAAALGAGGYGAKKLFSKDKGSK